MASNKLPPQVGQLSLRALIAEGSPLGPLKVMAEHVGRFFQIPIPGFRPYVVFGPEANRKVLVTERNKVLWRNTDPVPDLLGRGVLITDGDEHDRYRELMESPLHPSQLPGYTHMMIEQTDRISSTWKDGDTVDMLVESRRIARLSIMQTLFSRDAWEDLPRIWVPVLKAIRYISPGMWILWRKMPRPGYRKHLKVMDEYLFGIISDRRQWMVDNPQSNVNRPHDLLQHLIDAGHRGPGASRRSRNRGRP